MSILYLLLFLVIYFIPTIISVNLKKKDTAAIFVLNFFLGWTFVGWVAAFIWAVKEE